MASDLPSDLLSDIFSRLLISDFIRSSAVCKLWRRVTAEKYRTATEIPLLMIPGDEDEDSGKLFSPTERKVYPFPQIRGKRFLGSSDGGWVITIDDLAELHIHNPFTGAQVNVPSITTFSCIRGLGHDPNDDSSLGYMIQGSTTVYFKDLESMVNYNYYRVIYFPSAKTTVTITTPFRYLSFAREGDNSWTDLNMRGLYKFMDIIPHKGQLFAVNSDGLIVAYDLGDSNHPPCNNIYSA